MPVFSIHVILKARILEWIAMSSTIALTNATLRYALALADKGWQQACRDDESLRRGLNIVEGKVTFKAVADVFGLPYEPWK